MIGQMLKVMVMTSIGSKYNAALAVDFKLAFSFSMTFTTKNQGARLIKEKES